MVAYTDGSCLNNGETSAKAGSGVWFGEDDETNASLRVPGPDQSNQTGELVAILYALKTVPPDRALTTKTDSMYAILGPTKNLEKWEDKGWLDSKHAGIFRCLTAWVRFRSNTTKIAWVKIGKFWTRIENYGRRGICSHCEAEKSTEHILTPRAGNKYGPSRTNYGGSGPSPTSRSTGPIWAAAYRAPKSRTVSPTKASTAYSAS